MKKTIIIAFLGVFASLLPSCIKDDRDDCPSGLYIQLDWINTAPRSNQEQVNLSVTPVDFEWEETDLTSGTYGRYVDLIPYNYRIVGWEDGENISIAGDTVTLATGPYDYALEPSVFGGGSALAEVYPDRNNQILHLPMRQQTRPLCIRVFFTGYGVPAVQELEAVLEGVTIQRKINNAFAPADGNARPPAIQSGSARYYFGMEEDHWYATKRLIGVDGGSSQELTLVATFPGGHTDTVTLDVTGDMFGYHTQDVKNPWCITLTVDITELLIMTITDWYAGTDSWIVAE